MSPAIEAMRAGRERAALKRLLDAKAVCAAHREYEKASAIAFAVGRDYGFGTPEHHAAKQAVRTRFPEPPPLPTKGQMVLVYGEPDVE